MNKEVEEAKEWLKNDLSYLEEEFCNPNFIGRFITIRDKEYKKLKILLNYIQELEEDNNGYNEETIALNNRIMDLEESIHKERELAEAQTTYEVNEMWKEKIRDKINMLKDEITRFYEEEQELGRYDEARLEMIETVEEELLNEEE